MSTSVLSYNTQQQQQEEQLQRPQYYVSIGKMIGSGKTSDVYICYINNQLYALKNYKDEHLKFLQKEVKALSQLAHPNIVQFIGQANETGILLENCSNGEVFDYIQAAQGNFPQELARFYSMQLAHALAYIHASDFAHLDIKLENCLFDSEFNLKLADFGFASESNSNKLEERFIGTHRYMSPEIEKSQKYNAKKADVFALGCVIFILELGFQPIHTKATQDDKYYQYFAHGRLDIFWKWLEKSYKKTFNADFKDLISKMMCYDPKQRCTIEQVLNHKYFQGLVYDRESRIQHMNNLKVQIAQNNNQN